MQFIPNGPDVPERLLQAHEDGRVVFFCGAGISYPAGLPGFDGLVQRLYEDLSVNPNPAQQSAITAKQYDTAIGLLESYVVGGREVVRQALAKILTADPKLPNATITHEALLTLAKRDGRTRLITTNFDRLFEEVKTAKALSLPTFQAPLLPVPKEHWDGLVYLHGMLPAEPTAADLDRLVASSGDFGRAYLTERWAARFVSELFRKFTVCFVGYSINDPVMRYMLDALAADQLLGESPPEMFAFGSYSKGKEEERVREWRAKNVTPILYREHRHHAYLRKTLCAWAKTYHDGAGGKEAIVAEYAMAHPLASTKQDDLVGRMLWALSDPRGLPAKRFAEIDPVPSLDWLVEPSNAQWRGPLSELRYGHADLGRFGVPPQATEDKKLTTEDKKLTFSLINRPTPYRYASRMAIADSGYRTSQWDPVMSHLARWLIRHLNDPKLLLWLTKQGGQLHDQFIQLIKGHIDELDKLIKNDSKEELDRIRKNSPNAIPGPAMRTLWRLMLNGHVKSDTTDWSNSIYSWNDQLKSEGLTVSVRLAIRKVLRPCVSLGEPFHLSGLEMPGDKKDDQERISKFVKCDVVLASDLIHSGLHKLSQNEHWAAALPDLLDDFNILLHDAFDLMHELDGANSESDLSYLHQPSISNHSQNMGFRHWTALIELTRDAWLATAAKSPDRARITAEAWAHGPYPVFRRLAFFAAAQRNVIPSRMALDWLLADERRWLWSVETCREAMRLLVSLPPQLDESMLTELEQAILSGPPRFLYRNDIESNEWNYAVDREVWRRLAKIAQAGAALSDEAKKRLNSLVIQYPWQLATDERDEFPSWMESGSLDPPIQLLPQTSRDIQDYLLKHPKSASWPMDDDWHERCSKSFRTTSIALWRLAQQDSWPVARWRDALQVWTTEDKLRNRSWRFMAPVIIGMPDDVMKSLAHAVSWWLETVAKTFEEHKDYFVTLIQRILQGYDKNDGADDLKDDDATDSVVQAFKHPVGHVTQALLGWWYRQKPSDNQGLLEMVKPIFIRLCDTEITKFRHGRVLLAVQVLSLFRVDKDWSGQYLLPLLDWNQSEVEARAAWQGFLYSPRLYHPLMEKIKPSFLDTVHHYSDLGDYKQQCMALLTWAALDSRSTFADQELQTAFSELPEDGLRKSAEVLVKALQGAAEQRENYFENRILPFWKKIWPQSTNKVSKAYAWPLTMLCIEAGNKFPSAVDMVVKWLAPINDSLDLYVINRFREENLSTRFPKEALQFLFCIVVDRPIWLPPGLRQCLDDIVEVEPGLREDREFIRLDDMMRGFEGE